MTKYTEYSMEDFSAYTLDVDKWPASMNKKYKKWRESLGSLDEIRQRSYEDWLNIARALETFWEQDQFPIRFFYEIAIEEDIIDTTRIIEIAFRQVHTVALVEQVNELHRENEHLHERLRALGHGSVPVGYKTKSSVPDRVIEKANKVFEQYQSGEVKARSTMKHSYDCIEVGINYRLLDRGNGFELMSHEDYNRLIDK
ncbi:hypothetical protein ABXV18_24775 [Vibrio owensii]|uniref:ParE family toxin-like protein n=1 Tax=Vibrio owensii TaxID=696485 RepID=UPI00339B1D5A